MSEVEQEEKSEEKSADSTEIPCVVVGDASVGKTRLLMSYANNSFHSTYIPVPFKNYSANVIVDGERTTLQLQDTAWQDENYNQRVSYYTQARVFLVCFSLIDPASYENVYTKWFQEVKEYCSHVVGILPVILIGTKVDLCENEEVKERLKAKNLAVVRAEQGLHMCKRLNAAKYVECSALTQDGLQEVFTEVARIGLSQKKLRAEQQYHGLDGFQTP